jgi:uncharacterized membrane protein
MDTASIKPKTSNFLLPILFLQLTVYFTTIFNIQVARQVIGFVYFTFVPGYVLIKLLKMKMGGLAETILFSAGLSIAILMLIGLMVNEFHSLFAIQKPLSLAFLFPTISGFIIICTVAAYFRNKNERGISLNLRVEKPLIVLFLLCIPLLSVMGAIVSGAYGDNRIVLLTLIIIAAVFLVTVVSRKAIPSKLYPLILLVIALSLVYHAALISDKIIHFGSDLPGEVFVQKFVERNYYWSPKGPYPGDESVGRSHAMLSVTLLPTMYTILLNLDSILVFKLFYPLLFALVPLGLYLLWKSFVGEKFAFVSSFLFMSFQPFYGELLGLNKQILAELFLVLLLTVLLSKDKDKLAKNVCLLLFSFGLVVSHYGLAEISLFFVAFAAIFLLIRRKPSKNISATFVFLFFTLMFLWYIFTSSSAVYDAFLSFGQRVYNELGDIFNLQAREPEIIRGLGLEPPPTIWNFMSRVFAYITEFFIFTGFLWTAIKDRKRGRLGREFSLFVFVAMLFLFALIVVPSLSSTMGMTRFYNVLLFFIAPLCPIGAATIIKLTFKHESEFKTLLLLFLVFAAYFLFQTGFVYEVTQTYSWSVPLSKHRMGQLRLYSEFGYIDAYSVSGAQWLSRSVKIPSVRIYADVYSRVNELRAYGVIYTGYVEVLSNATLLKDSDVVYLNPVSVVENLMIGKRYFWNTSDLQFLSELNKVYSNGASEVYKK